MASANKSKRKQQKQKQVVPTWAWVSIAAALILIIGGVIWISRPQAGNSFPTEITVAQAAAKHDAGVFLLDVRQPDEWADYHIAGTTLIPLDQLPNRLNELPKDKEIVVVCHSGNRSAQGRDVLRNAGFTQVSSMAGGLVAWQNAGYPTVSGP